MYTKTDEFPENFRKEGGVISDPKNFIAIFFCIRNGNFGNEFAEKIAMKFSEKGAGGGRGGQRPFGNFPEIHSFPGRQASLTLTNMFWSVWKIVAWYILAA